MGGGGPVCCVPAVLSLGELSVLAVLGLLILCCGSVLAVLAVLSLCCGCVDEPLREPALL